MTTPYQLISFKLCPFVQRSTITLEEKAISYNVRYIDLANKPDWFLKLSPLGKVPVLQVEDTVLFESAVINEFIDETSEGERLLPADPLQRAYLRAWIELASALIGDAYRLQVAADEETALRRAASVKDKLSRLEQQLVLPLFQGEAFTLMDCATAPCLQRLLWTDQLAPELGLFEATPKVVLWRDALLARPSVKRSAVNDIRQLWFDSVSARSADTWLGQR